MVNYICSMPWEQGVFGDSDCPDQSIHSQGLPCQLKESLDIVEYIDAGFSTNSLLEFFLLPKSCSGISELRDKDPDWCMNHQCKFNFIYFWLWCQTQRPLISNPEGKQCWCIWTAICQLWIGQFSTEECWYLSFWVTSSWFKKGSCQLLAKYVSKVLVKCIEEGVWLSEAKVSCILLHRGIQLILANSWGRPANLVSCILLHRGVQLILANSWGRPANLAVGKSRGGGGGGIFLFLLFLHFHQVSSFSPVPLFHLLYYLFYLLLFSGTQHKMTYKGWLNQDTIKNCIED